MKQTTAPAPTPLSAPTSPQTETPAEETEAFSPMQHRIIAPSGDIVATIDGSRKEVRAWVAQHGAQHLPRKKDRLLVETVQVWSTSPKGEKLTKEQRTQRSVERKAAIAAKKAQRAVEKAERAKVREAKKAAKAAEKAERAKGGYDVVKTKAGASITVKKPAATTAQLQALARARQKADAQKAQAKVPIPAVPKRK